VSAVSWLHPSPLLERIAFHDFGNEIPHSITVVRKRFDNFFNRWPIVVLDTAPDGVGQHFFRKAPNEIILFGSDDRF
jgi:hypothetical protein